MNTSVNYSGFIDLLGSFVAEKNSRADQDKDGQQESALKTCVQQDHGIQPAQAMGAREQDHDND